MRGSGPGAPLGRSTNAKRLAGRVLLAALIPVLGAVACAGEEKAPPGEDPDKEQREQQLVGEPEAPTVSPEPGYGAEGEYIQ